ncbi:PKD domain-containing protein [Paraflavitalea pollutisoli]|uniref:PKD domain-containing protein n=1 Tax=Paraflavitalea pollutisoli TaxID=3034143 RepID=UPI0023EE236A|nr:PKD domain-containing protein [Paraflavitalea sp. H1-2-19X]
MRNTPPVLVFLARQLTCCLFLLLCYQTQAQLRAQFTSDVTAGCSPLSVAFTNTSTGTSASTQYSWDFGNGNTSSLVNPGAIFTTPNVYPVKLTITSGGQSATYSVNITVRANPVVSFVADKSSGCIPLPVQFTATATQPGTGSISSYYWDFGDGFTEEKTAASVQHIYQVKQSTAVSLTVKNDAGCHSTVTQKDLIDVRPLLLADFVSDNKVLCQVNDPVRFTNKSKGPGTLTYLWDFGNGQTSGAPDPSPTFNTRGSYTVKLTVNSSEGCTATKTASNYLNVANYAATIQMPPSGCTKDAATFKAVCTPLPDKIDWEIDGVPQTKHDDSLKVPFLTPGTYTIKLIATFGNCIQEATASHTVNGLPPLTDINYTTDPDCFQFGAVTFKDNTPGAVRWEWDFQYRYWEANKTMATTREASYTFQNANTWPVRLKIFDAGGCTAEIIKDISVIPANIDINIRFEKPALYYGNVSCGPNHAYPKATNSQHLVKYQWSLDGKVVSTDPEPAIFLATPGSHSIRLDYETDKGCKGFVENQSVLMFRIPKPDFESASGTTVCGNTPVRFVSKSQDKDVFNSELYVINGVMPQPQIGIYGYYIHTFTESGPYTIKMISSNTGCVDSITKTAYITVKPGFVRITGHTQTCEDRLTVKIAQTSKEVDTYVWNFGDGQSATMTTNEPEIEHTYAQDGAYKVLVTAITAQCEVKDSIMVYIRRKSTPTIAVDPAQFANLCPGQPLPVTFTNLTASPNPAQWFHYYMDKWEYSDGTTFTGSNNAVNNQVYPLAFKTQLTGLDAAQSRIRVILKEANNGCLDTSNYITYNIKGSLADYTLLNNDVCFNAPLQIKDVSTSSPGTQIQRWDWDFGDGQRQAATQGGIVSHQYAHPGTYHITLKVSDNAGCTSTTVQQTTQSARINGPQAAFDASAANIPLNGTIQLTNKSNDFSYNRATYRWDFGNGTYATEASTTIRYTVPGPYTITLTATDPVTGCTSIDSRSVLVGPATADFAFNKVYVGKSNCLPLLVRFSSNTVGIDSVSWDFGDGTRAGNTPAPTHIYNQPGKYYITLTSYGPHTTLQKLDSVIILEPQTTFRADQWEGCPGQTVTWDLTGINTQGYTWDFGDGNTSTAQSGSITHNYPLPGSYAPTLLMKDVNGCITAVSISDKVTIHPNPTIRISPVAGTACLGQPITLTASGATTYQWLPASGLDNAQATQPIATPAQTTTYTVEGTDQHGCKNTTAYTLTVHQPFTLQIAPEATLCEGDKTTLRATGADRYSWINSTNGIDNIVSPTPTINPSVTTSYTLVGYDRVGCFTDTATVHATVHPRPQVQASKDTAVQPGDKAYLTATATGDQLKWAWTPANYLSCTNCNNPISTPQAEMIYKVTATNQYNCSASDEVVVKLLCDESRVRIPNAFSPNNDGNNDHFVVLGVSVIKHMIIYNRWGNKVFEGYDIPTNNKNRLWDGNMNGIPQPVGTYVYYMELQCPKGELFNRKGAVTLVR